MVSKRTVSRIVVCALLLASTSVTLTSEPSQQTLSEFCSLRAVSKERIEVQKKAIEQMVNKRKWGRSGIRIASAVSTAITLAELAIFGKSVWSALNAEPIAEAEPQKQETPARSLVSILGTYVLIASAQAFTSYLLNRYYEQIMHDETINWYVFTKAFYKVTTAEIMQQVKGLQESAEPLDQRNSNIALNGALNAFIEQIEKIIAFMEYKLERLPIENRPEARALVNHFYSALEQFVLAIAVNGQNKLSIPKLVPELHKLESIVERGLVSFSRLEGNQFMSEQQYSTLAQYQTA